MVVSLLVMVVAILLPELVKSALKCSIITEHKISDGLSNSDVKARVYDLFQIFGLIDADFSSLMTIFNSTSFLLIALSLNYLSQRRVTER
jgi:hypothetical protein